LGRASTNTAFPFLPREKGKRAGGRAITLNVLVEEDEMEIGFLYIYDKSERTNITDKEIMEIKSKNGL